MVYYYWFENHILVQQLKEKGLFSLLLCLYSCLIETKNCCEIKSCEFNVLSLSRANGRPRWGLTHPREHWSLGYCSFNIKVCCLIQNLYCFVINWTQCSVNKSFKSRFAFQNCSQCIEELGTPSMAARSASSKRKSRIMKAICQTNGSL